MGTIHLSESEQDSPIFRSNQLEALTKDGHQTWHRLVLYGFKDSTQFEGTIHKYETWSEPSSIPDQLYRGIRGQGDKEANKERAARRAKKKIRHACKSAGFDRMITLTTRDAIFDRSIFQKMISKFILLARKATGDTLPYVLALEKHDSAKTSEAKRGSLHAHIAVRGRQDYKLLQTIWNFRICHGRGFVRVSNGTRNMSTSRIASYISKYISKTITCEEANKKSYWISHNIEAPTKTVRLFRSFSEALAWLVDFYKSTNLPWSFKQGRCWQDSSLGVLWMAAG